MNTSGILVVAGYLAPLAALIGAITMMSVNRNNAVKLLTDAAAAVGEDNKAMRYEMRLLREAVMKLTDAVDEAVPELNLGPVRTKLVEANTVAKLAV